MNDSAAPLPDREARDNIRSDLDTNILVEAGAGSGKTTSLLGRMVELVRTGTASMQEIAAVTFTRKAAGELRERFQVDLEAGLRAEAVGTKERERLEVALRDLEQLFLGTIHSFCARLLRERPLDAGLDPSFEELTEEVTGRLAKDFWASYLERLTLTSDPVLARLVEVGLHPRVLEGLFLDVCQHPDVTFPAEEGSRPADDQVELVRARLIELMDRAEEMMPRDEPAKGWDAVQKKVQALRYSLRVLGWDGDVAFFRALAEVCRRTSYRVTLVRWSEDGVTKARVKELGADFAAFVEPGGSAQRLMTRWRTHRYGIVMTMVEDAARGWAQERIRTGRLSFQDLLMLAVQLLRSNAEARRELGERFRRILVDEFQDTDPIQAELLMLLASEPPAEGPLQRWVDLEPRPGALFLVGDPKQSIYRFRRADIGLYNQIKGRFRTFGAVLGLEANFRSLPEIASLVNEVFQQDGYFPAEETVHQAPFAPVLPQRRGGARAGEGVSFYFVEEGNRDTVVSDDAGKIATWIAARCGSDGDRVPEDFLVLTRYLKDLDPYARALEAHGLPVSVSGTGIGDPEETLELVRLVESLADPGDVVKLAAVLVGPLFGVSYEDLLAHSASGGRFSFVAPYRQPEGAVTRVLRRLNRWWEATRREPADGVLARIVDEIGLLPQAVSGPLGQLRSGTLLYALDAAGSAGDTSVVGALDAMRLALDAKEVEAPLQPGLPGAVRVMNVHKAKGLQAPVVMLAAPVGEFDRDPQRHITRREDGTAVGYLVVQERQRRMWNVHAMPPGWSEKQEEEARFESAEQVRLLYVATTRARDELIVARRREGSEKSSWKLLDSWLSEKGRHLVDIAAEEPPPRPKIQRQGKAILEEIARTDRKRHAKTLPQYDFRSVTSVAKAEEQSVPQLQLSLDETQESPPDRPSRGFSWGTVVHGALAAAADGGLPRESLARICHGLLVENERPVDANGKPAELDELMALIETLSSSDLWRRARASERLVVETPFSTLMPQRTQAGGDRRGPSGGPSLYVEGVIDLAFMEADGWSIADYKTDVGTDPGFPARHDSYRKQVDLYAECWSLLTGEAVKERILFYTTQQRLEIW